MGLARGVKPAGCVDSRISPAPHPMIRPGKVSPLVYILALPAAVLIFAAVVLVARRTRVGDAEPFPYSAYLRDAEPLRGNTYLVRAQIESRVAYAEKKGSVYSVKLLDNTAGRLAVFVPESVRRDIEAGQRYDMRVVLKRDRLVVEAMEKP